MHFELVFPLLLYLCLHGYPQLVAVSLAPCHNLNKGCKPFLKRFHASCQQNKTLFDTVSAGFLYMLITHQKVARGFRVFSFKANEI